MTSVSGYRDQTWCALLQCSLAQFFSGGDTTITSGLTLLTPIDLFLIYASTAETRPRPNYSLAIHFRFYCFIYKEMFPESPKPELGKVQHFLS